MESFHEILIEAVEVNEDMIKLKSSLEKRLNSILKRFSAKTFSETTEAFYREETVKEEVFNMPFFSNYDKLLAIRLFEKEYRGINLDTVCPFSLFKIDTKYFKHLSVGIFSAPTNTSQLLSKVFHENDNFESVYDVLSETKRKNILSEFVWRSLNSDVFNEQRTMETIKQAIKPLTAFEVQRMVSFVGSILIVVSDAGIKFTNGLIREVYIPAPVVAIPISNGET